MTSLPGPDDFEYRGWLVYIELTSTGDTIAGRADLHRDGMYKCRLVLASARLDRASACLALESKSKDFIDEWTARPHLGDSKFQEL